MMIKPRKLYLSTALILAMISVTPSAFAMKEGDEGEKETTEIIHISRKKAILQAFPGEGELNELSASKSAKALEILDPIFGVGSDEVNKEIYLQAKYILDFCKFALRKPYNEEHYSKAQESLKGLLTQGKDQGENLEFIKDPQDSVIMSKKYLLKDQLYFDLYDSKKEEEALSKLLNEEDFTDLWLLLKIMSEKGVSTLQEGTRKQFSDYLFENLNDKKMFEFKVRISLFEEEPDLSFEEINAKVSKFLKDIHSWVKSRLKKYNYDPFIRELFANNPERLDFYTQEFGAE